MMIVQPGTDVRGRRRYHCTLSVPMVETKFRDIRAATLFSLNQYRQIGWPSDTQQVHPLAKSVWLSDIVLDRLNRALLFTRSY